MPGHEQRTTWPETLFALGRRVEQHGTRVIRRARI